MGTLLALFRSSRRKNRQSRGKTRRITFEPLERRELLAVFSGFQELYGLPAAEMATANSVTAGALDPTFGSHGTVRTNFSGTDWAEAIAIQRDGKILVAGTGGDDFALARYDDKGELDASFGRGGRVRTNFAGVDRARALVLDSNNRIIVAGGVNNDADFGLARYHADGRLDTSFGPDRSGKVITHFSGIDRAYALALDSHGKIIVAGAVNNNADFGLARYHADGRLDTSFGPDRSGKVTTHFSGADRAYALVVDSHGRIIVAGGVNNDADFGLARYHADGRLDTSFGPDRSGKVTTHFSGVDRAYALALDSHGRIIVAGGVNNDADFGLARYHANGTLDTSFGPNRSGKVTTNFSGVDRARGLTIQPDGKIIVVGGVNNNADFGLARYHANGTLDTSFGQRGKVVTNFSGTDWAAAVALQADGKIVVVGNGGEDFGVARYLNDFRGQTPAAPTALTAQAVTSTSVTLSWRDNANNETGFRVEWREAGRSWQSASIGVNSTRHMVTGLRPAIRYEFRVCAFNSAGNSSYAGPITVQTPGVVTRPAAPTQLSVQTVTSTSITLGWRDNSNNETGFRVEWREAGRPWQSTSIGANSTRHTVAGLRPATRYEFRVCAVNSAGNSSYAGPVSAQTPVAAPAAPSHLTAQAASDTSITLNWRDNANNETGFRVEWREVGRSWQGVNIGANSTRHTVTGLRPATTYELRVRAHNSAGGSAYAGPVTQTTRPRPVPPPVNPVLRPDAPIHLTAQAATSTSVTLNWRDQANNETGFRIEWREVGMNWQTTTVGANVTRYTIGGLKPETRYEIRVCAFNNSGSSTYASTTFVPSRSNNLVAGERLLPGQEIRSADGRYRFNLQFDGNLVLYGPRGRALWSTRTAGRPVTSAVMQSDGNFVLYNNSRAVWHTRTHGNSGARLVVLDSGNVVIRAQGGRILWRAL